MDLFIGCSSKNEIPEKYKKDCEKYLNELLKNNNLIFGTDNTGLMGLSHDIAVKNKRQITGVCPKMYKKDFDKLNCTKQIVTETTIERMKTIIEISDALVFLPGGFGTFAELLLSIDSKRCHEFDKPIIIYNSNNYFKKLLIAFDKMYQEKFSNEDISNVYHISSNSEDTLEYIEKYYQKINKTKIKTRQI